MRWWRRVDSLPNLGNRAAMSMDLETYRRSRGLTWRQLQALVGASSESQVRRWALGIEWPRADRLDAICKATGNEVDVYSMHLRRLEWVRANRRPIASDQEELVEDDEPVSEDRVV